MIYSKLQFLIAVTCILIELVSICITIRRYCTAKSRKRTQERCWPDSIPTFLFTFQIKSLCLLHVEESQNTSTSHSEQCVRYLMQTDGPVRKPKLNRIQTHQQSGLSRYIGTAMTSWNYCSQGKWRPFLKSHTNTKKFIVSSLSQSSSGTFSEQKTRRSIGGHFGSCDIYIFGFCLY